MSKKAIVLSIKPKLVDLILNGEKTIEIRKRKPNCKLPIDVYIYCSKGINYENSGKVCAKFTLNGCIGIDVEDINNLGCHWSYLQNAAQLTREEMLNYSNGQKTFGWCIDNLERVNITLEDLGLTRAPQSYCYVERKLK